MLTSVSSGPRVPRTTFLMVTSTVLLLLLLVFGGTANLVAQTTVYATDPCRGDDLGNHFGQVNGKPVVEAFGWVMNPSGSPGPNPLYGKVTITVDLKASTQKTQNFEAYLMTKIGPGTTTKDEITHANLQLAKATSAQPTYQAVMLFSNIVLRTGTNYFVVLYSTQDSIDWASDNVHTTFGSGVANTFGPNTVMGATSVASYVPASGIVTAFKNLSSSSTSLCFNVQAGATGNLKNLAQQVRIDPVANPLYYAGVPYTVQLIATADSGGPVTFTPISGRNSLTSSGLLTIGGVGPVIIKATQAGTNIYSSATATLTLRVEKSTSPPCNPTIDHPCKIGGPQGPQPPHK